MTRYEQETIINYNQKETTAQIYTCDISLIRKLDKLCKVFPTITVAKSDNYGKAYILPKKWIKVKPPRQLSDEKRSELAERAKRNFKRNENNGK